MPTPIYLSTLETHGLQLSSLITELDENFPPTNPHPDDSHSLICLLYTSDAADE